MSQSEELLREAMNVFQVALDLDPAAREDFLATACANDHPSSAYHAAERVNLR